MKKVFADAFYFFALANLKDAAHAKAVAFLNTYAGLLVTSVWVLMETADGLAAPANRDSFLFTLKSLTTNPNVLIVPCDARLFADGVDLYRRRPDKEWSLTDCISFVIVQRDGIMEALTGDHHLEQAGFIALLKQLSRFNHARCEDGRLPARTLLPVCASAY